VKSGDDELPKVFYLNQNYPNPFNPGTIIEFSVAKENHIVLEVFNTVGQRVAKLFEGKINPGKHSILFDGSNLESGVYYYRLGTSQGAITRKMMIVR
jgi:hypothetical protein